MPGEVQLTDATVIINNESVGIVPNSLKYVDGGGESKVRVMSTGGGKVETVYSNDVETKLGKVMFEMLTTPGNADLIRVWKALRNGNVAQVAGETVNGNLTRTLTQGAMVNDPEVEIGSEGNIAVEMHGNPLI